MVDVTLLAGGCGLVLLGIAVIVASRLLLAVQYAWRADDVFGLLILGGWVMIAVGGLALVAGALMSGEAAGILVVFIVFAVIVVVIAASLAFMAE